MKKSTSHQHLVFQVDTNEQPLYMFLYIYGQEN